MKDQFTGSDVNQIEPLSLSHIKGQPQVTDTLDTLLRGYSNTRFTNDCKDLTFGPVCLAGPPGTGKSLVAKAIHGALGNLRLHQTNGDALNKRPEFCAAMLHADENTTVFIDEAQGMNASTQHNLLTAISERFLPISADPANSASLSFHIPLKPFTLILATTHEHVLQEALRNRMRVYCRFEYYSAADLTEIVRQRADAVGLLYESPELLRIIAERARGTARQALNRNLETCWQVAQSHDRDVITRTDVEEAFRLMQIDECGLEEIDRRYLRALSGLDGATLGLLSAKLGLPPRTIQYVIEPYLIREGLISKGKSSTRMLTERGRDHLTTSACVGEPRRAAYEYVTKP
jgi:Holliday junction DNA helicase RuvB